MIKKNNSIKLSDNVKHTIIAEQGGPPSIWRIVVSPTTIAPSAKD